MLRFKTTHQPSINVRMSPSSHLNKLKFTQAKIQRVASPVTVRRSKLLLQLRQQLELAQATLKGERFVAYKEQHVKDLESGGTKTQKVEKRVKQWFYQSEDGTWFMDVRYANRRLLLADAMTTIEVGHADNLIPVINTLIEAASAGELDDALMKVKSR